MLRHSPGLEEFALRAIFQEALLHHADTDVIVADMPPTALALRFFASPTGPRHESPSLTAYLDEHAPTLHI